MSSGGARVVHAVRSDSFAGVEKYVTDVVTELHVRGWQVSVIGGDRDRMRSTLPVTIRHTPARTTVDVVRSLSQGRPIALVHSHMSSADLASAVTGPAARGRVSTRHFAAPRGRSPVSRRVMRAVERRLDVSLSISGFVLAASGGTDTLAYNGVRSLGHPVPWTERRNQVLVMQRLETEKDTRTVLEAWNLSDAAASGWNLVVAGRGSQQEDLQVQAVHLGIRDSVTFAGFVADPKHLIEQSKLVIASAPAEPFGLVVVEAMAAATPVLAADAGAHRETLGPGGRFFTAGDAHACATGINSLLSSQAAAAAYGRSLRDRQQSKFSLSHHVDALEIIYADVLRQKADSR